MHAGRPPVSRSRRAIFTYATGWVVTLVTLVLGLVAVPLILRWLGEERYGAYRAVADWFGYLTLFELGIGGALLPLLARAVGRSDAKSLGDMLGAGVRAYARVTVLMVGAGVLLIWVVGFLVPVTPSNLPDLRVAAAVGVLGVLVTPLLPLRWLHEARQEGYRVNVLLLVQGVAITATALLLAYRGFGITGQMAALVVGNAVFFGALAWRHRPALAGMVAGARRARASAASRELWALNRPTFVRQVCGRVALLSDRIIVAALLGPAMVVPLFVTQRLADVARERVQAIAAASWAALAELHAQGRHETFTDRVAELTNLAAALALAVLVPIVAYNGAFVALWVGPDRYAGDGVSVVVGLNGVLLAVIVMWDVVFGGTGKVASLVPVTLVATAVNVSLSLVLTPRLGVLGPLVGTLVATAGTFLWYLPVLMRRVFGIPVRRILGAAAPPVAWAVPYGGVVWWMAHRRQDLGWTDLALEMSAATLTYLALWWWLMQRPHDRARHLDRLRGLASP